MYLMNREDCRLVARGCVSGRVVFALYSVHLAATTCRNGVTIFVQNSISLSQLAVCVTMVVNNNG